jgi:GAF domain-containing protein
VIAAATNRDEPFPTNTESQIARFTELVATAVESAEAREALRRIAAEQAALRRVATLVARGAEPAAVFEAVPEEIRVLFDADATALIRFESNGEATFLGGRGWSMQRLPGTRFEPPPGQGLSSVREKGLVAHYGTDDAASITLPEEMRQEGVRYAVVAPIAVEGLYGGRSTSGRGADRFPSGWSTSTGTSELS